jgi:pyruvate,orthophosphate dikinase
MVYGNMGKNSGTGVALPEMLLLVKISLTVSTLIDAQGEDVVAGVRTPQQITKEGSTKDGPNLQVSLKKKEKQNSLH